jgi:cupin superfamily acireductone dioxygenase involved in methionine salvage
MNFASAIKAIVRGGTDISARRGRTQRTGGTLMLRVIVLAESGQLSGLLSTLVQTHHHSNDIIRRIIHPPAIFVVVLFR